MARICVWCRGAIPPGSRRDALCCSKRCRQARHRFTSAVGVAPAAVADGHPRRLAYADPPYPGKAGLYRDHPDYGGEVDHAALLAALSAEHDAWALSTSAEALQDVLAVAPRGTRVAAWHRGERPHASAGVPLNAWEPVLYGGQIIRRPTPADASRLPASATRRADDPFDASRPPGDDTSRSDRRHFAEDLHDASPVDERRVDSLVYFSRPRLTDPDRVIGAKPAAFCRWLFLLLAAQPADTFVDVFPGSGGVARAWEAYIEPSRHAAAQHDASRYTAAQL